MKKLGKGFIPVLIGVLLVFSGCSTLNRTQKGAAVGAATGAAMGAVVGKAAADNPALGAIIGATVGGAAGAVIGHQMDKQAEEIKNKVPDAKVVRVGEGIVVEFSSAVLFAFDKSDLSYEAKNNLDKLVKILNEYPDTNIEVQGHTDSKGTNAYNQGLSVRRASSVTDYLTARGIYSNRLTIKGFGEEYPKYPNDTEANRAQNRRVEFLISANEKMKAEAQKQSAN